MWNFIYLQELDALKEVWELTAEWNTAWESYQTGEFWTADIKEMEDNVSYHVYYANSTLQLCHTSWSLYTCWLKYSVHHTENLAATRHELLAGRTN